MKLKNILFIILFVTFCACKKSAQLNATATATATATIKLGQCFQQGTGSKAISLCFDSVVNDSRCPKNTECIWKGIALAKFTFSSDNHTNSFILANSSIPHYPADTVLQGYKITFLNLYPYPGDTVSAVKAEVKISQ